MTTSPPCEAIILATSAPTPLAPPTTAATLPLNDISILPSENGALRQLLDDALARAITETVQSVLGRRTREQCGVSPSAVIQVRRVSPMDTQRLLGRRDRGGIELRKVVRHGANGFAEFLHSYDDLHQAQRLRDRRGREPAAEQEVRGGRHAHHRGQTLDGESR